MVGDERDGEHPEDRARRERREETDDQSEAGRELGEAREPRVQDSRLHAEALEPARGALDLPAR